jgi:hypothetical protein
MVSMTMISCSEQLMRKTENEMAFTITIDLSALTDEEWAAYDEYYAAGEADSFIVDSRFDAENRCLVIDLDADGEMSDEELEALVRRESDEAIAAMRADLFGE